MEDRDRRQGYSHERSFALHCLGNNYPVEKMKFIVIRIDQLLSTDNENDYSKHSPPQET